PIDDWTLRLEAALGIDNGLTSRAFLFGTTIDVSGYFLDAAVFSVGTFFPGSRADSAGIEVSQRLRLSALSLSVSLEHVWDNVIGDPLISTEVQDEMGFNLRTTPMQDGPTLSMTAEFTWDRYDDTALMSEIDSLLSVNMSQTAGVFPYTFSGKIADQIDHVVGTQLRTSTFSQGAGLSTDSFYLFLELSQEKQEDVVAETVLSSSSDVSLRFRPEGALHEASITLGNTADSFDLSASLTIRFVEDLDIVFDGSISWDRTDSANVSFGWGITFSANVGIPMPFLVTKARIEGRAYIDRDLDGRYSIADVPAGGIVVAADQTEVSTNEDGVFRFPPLYPETYTISVAELPRNAAAPPPVEIELEAEETRWIEIPLTPVVVLTGRVFDDVNRDGLASADESGFGQVRVLLRDDLGSILGTVTDLTGAYVFLNVLPGRYSVSIDSATLPDRFEFTTDPEIGVDVGYGELPEVALGGFVRPREVIITFQPPTADFEVSPDPPVAGAPVFFDGTSSFDFDGEIIAYVWDFDGDGNADATDATAEHVYANAGTYAVSLTVVDNGGNADTLTIDVQIVAPSAPGVSTLYPPIADFSYAPSAPSAGSPVMFDGTLSSDFDGDIATYAWDFDGDLEPDAASAVAEHSFASSGTYSVSLTVIDNGGNSDTITYTLQVSGGRDAETPQVGDEPGAEDEVQTPQQQSPVAAFVYVPVEPQPGTAVTFNGTASLDLDGMVAAFAWDFDADGEIDSTEGTVEYAFAEAGTYAVTLAVADNDGNTDVITHTIVVAAQAPAEPASNLYPPIAEFGYSPAEPRPGVPVLFNGTSSADLGGTIISYAWDFDVDLAIDASSAIAEHAFPSAGIYPVSLTVTDDAGNSDTTTHDVRIVAGAESAVVDTPEPQQPPIADYSYQPAAPGPGILITFDGSLSTDPDGLIVNYTWDFAGDIQTPSGIPHAQYAFVEEGNYSVSLMVLDDSGSSDTVTYLIAIGEEVPDLPPPPTTFQPPVADYSYMPGTPLAGEIVMFNGTLSFDFDGVIASYAWDFNGDGGIDSTDAIAEHIFPSPGLYNVSLRVTDNSAISDTITYPITIE
ncbi:PKD domain-containing protein, partial [Candidatus Bipolaricaulota bacterium]|nr:PKD domain-containing protein [Candidatus Bipolaricaulota bacterium]